MNKRKVSTTLTNVLDLSSISQVACDLKGPLERAPSNPSTKKKNPWDENRSRKFWILCLVNPITGMNQFFYLPDKKASTVVRTIYEKFIRYHSGITSISLDEGSEFIASCNAELATIMKYSLRFNCKSNPRANRAEISVGRVSHLLKAILQGSDFSIKNKLTDLSIICNSVYMSEISGLAANDAHGCSNGDALAYSPAILCDKEDYRHKGTHWSDVTDSMRHIIKLIREHYNCFITLKRSNLHTFESLNIKQGDVIYFRTYSKAHPIAIGLSTLCPSWSLGRVEKVLSRSAAIIRNLNTGARVRRHLSDIHPVWDKSDWALTSNWKTNFEAYQREKKGLDLDDAQLPEERDMNDMKAKSAMHKKRCEESESKSKSVNEDANEDAKEANEDAIKSDNPRGNERERTSDDKRKSNPSERAKTVRFDEKSVVSTDRKSAPSKHDKRTDEKKSISKNEEIARKLVHKLKSQDGGRFSGKNKSWSTLGNGGSVESHSTDRKLKPRGQTAQAQRAQGREDDDDEDDSLMSDREPKLRRSRRLSRKERINYKE